MEIQLSEPFSSKWRKGYLSIHPNQRKYVSLYNSELDKTIISYARYLMSVHLGYIVPSEYEVDHKNDDPTDDRVENFQLLTQEQNLIKQQYKFMMEQIHYGYHCAWCETPFLLTEREVNNRMAQGVELAFCCRSCAASYHHHVSGRANMQLDENLVIQIKQLRQDGLSSYKIADATGVSRNTVMKYW